VLQKLNEKFTGFKNSTVMLVLWYEIFNPCIIIGFLEANTWLKAFLASVEGLPVSVSVASAQGYIYSYENNTYIFQNIDLLYLIIGIKGFPLVYVNAYFETVTGYSRDEIIGHNCRFLQADDVTEKDIIKQISHALKDAIPLKVVITNKKKDGTLFKNLLSMKPIFNFKGDFLYVIAVQFDTTLPDSTPVRLNLANELLSIIPDTIFHES